MFDGETFPPGQKWTGRVVLARNFNSTTGITENLCSKAVVVNARSIFLPSLFFLLFLHSFYGIKSNEKRYLINIIERKNMRMKKPPISNCSVILFMGLLAISCSESSTKLEVTLQPRLIKITDSSLVLRPVPPYVVIIDDSAIFDQQTFTELPSPVGGLEAIQANLRYPKTAQQAGLEARVILNVSFDDRGKITACKAVKTVEGYGLTEAAIAAVKSVSWKPAKSFGKTVPASISVPILFRLD